MDRAFPARKGMREGLIMPNQFKSQECHKNVKTYMEGGWNFTTFCRTSLETLGSLQAVKQSVKMKCGS